MDLRQEDETIRDNFIRNILVNEVQRELLRGTVEPETAHSIAINTKIGHENQKRTSSNDTSEVIVVQQFNSFHGVKALTQQKGRNCFNQETT